MGSTSRMYVAVITGLSGDDFFLGRSGTVRDPHDARGFRSEQAAQEAGRAHIEAHPPVIRRHLAARVEPRA